MTLFRPATERMQRGSSPRLPLAGCFGQPSKCLQNADLRLRTLFVSAFFGGVRFVWCLVSHIPVTSGMGWRAAAEIGVGHHSLFFLSPVRVFACVAFGTLFCLSLRICGAAFSVAVSRSASACCASTELRRLFFISRSSWRLVPARRAFFSLLCSAAAFNAGNPYTTVHVAIVCHLRVYLCILVRRRRVNCCALLFCLKALGWRRFKRPALAWRFDKRRAACLPSSLAAPPLPIPAPAIACLVCLHLYPAAHSRWLSYPPALLNSAKRWRFGGRETSPFLRR